MPYIIVAVIAISLAVIAGMLLGVRKNLLRLIGAVCFLVAIFLMIDIVIPSL